MITNLLEALRWMDYSWKDRSFFLLVFVLILFFLYQAFKRNSSFGSLSFPQVHMLKKIPGSFKTRFSFLPTALKVIAVFLMIVSLARPQESNTKIKKNIEGIDIIIVLDVSDSMLIEDMKPLNRIESAKQTLQQFIEKRTSDRIGVVIFAGEAFTLVPPTLDYPLILDRVKDITTAANAKIKDGTALGVAMANGAARFKDSTAKSRVMIFLTDGENNSGTIDPETGLSIAKGYGIKVYSIGIGKDGPTRIPIYQKDMFGNTRKIYQPFESTVNDDLLGRMANETGGKYYRASREDSLSQVFNDIDRLEKTKIDVNKFTQYNEKFSAFLWLSFLFYGLAICLDRLYFRRLIS